MSVESTAQRRVTGLDGIRGLAALFVVVHHTYLESFPGYPVNTGPSWLAWLLYGHLAVVVFIALSGFSLAVAPARRNWQLGGKARFAHRRAWRILPPYWAALVFSCIIAWTIVPQPGSPAPDGKAVVVYGLLVQDIFGSSVPNGAFWSIAVEAQLYLVFPLMLLLVRRISGAFMVAAVTAVVVGVGLLAPHLHPVDMLMRLNPQMAVLFALGLATAGVLRASDRVHRLPWQWFTVAATVPVVILCIAEGTGWWEREHFWADLAWAPAIGLLLAAVATGRARSLKWVLDTAPVRKLGSFSYSLYLIHAPIVVAISEKVVGPRMDPGLPRFLVTLVIAVPLSVFTARWFAALFEIPFQRYRSWSALRAAARARFRPADAVAPTSPAPSPAPVINAPTAAPVLPRE
ncbi:acyltransferase family protein [Paractinoplanes globisporus]|uniref:Acyltransferase family protein n=1 Tax=Paractinoplanes globisporus TaxID=113565 RepID=A0ABW6W892_9ACTN|nr:acyltransferase [Actinoplanes globisporus]